jgi:hypothetical protein
MQPINPNALYNQMLIQQLMQGAAINRQYMDQGMEMSPGNFPDKNALLPQNTPPSVPGISPAWDGRQEDVSWRPR